MRHKIIIMPSRPSRPQFSAESVSSELSRPTRDSDSSRSGPRRIRLGRLVSDSAESLNHGWYSAALQIETGFSFSFLLNKGRGPVLNLGPPIAPTQPFYEISQTSVAVWHISKQGVYSEVRNSFFSSAPKIWSSWRKNQFVWNLNQNN